MNLSLHVRREKMSKRNILSISLLLSISTPALSHVLSFVDKDFNSFVNHIIPPPQREQFAAYYQRVDDRLKEKNEPERLKLRTNLYQTALNSLTLEHHAWANDIQMFLSDVRYFDTSFDQERSDVRNFLYWCGSYKAFQVTNKTKVARVDSKKFIDKIRMQLSKVTHKIGDWFKSLKTRLT